MVLQDFSASHSSELTIQVGQTVELLERPGERPGWCLVRTTERSPPQEGLVPSSALCISHSRSSVEMDCFFPLVKGRGPGGDGHALQEATGALGTLTGEHRGTNLPHGRVPARGIPLEPACEKSGLGNLKRKSHQAAV